MNCSIPISPSLSSVYWKNRRLLLGEPGTVLFGEAGGVVGPGGGRGRKPGVGENGSMPAQSVRQDNCNS